MTFQEAAHKILRIFGQPIEIGKLADTAFEKGLVKSKAKNSKRSFVETINKNIRGSIYNVPKLSIIKAPNGTFVVLPDWL